MLAMAGTDCRPPVADEVHGGFDPNAPRISEMPERDTAYVCRRSSLLEARQDRGSSEFGDVAEVGHDHRSCRVGRIGTVPRLVTTIGFRQPAAVYGFPLVDTVPKKMCTYGSQDGNLGTARLPIPAI